MNNLNISYLGYDSSIKRYCYKVRFINSYDCGAFLEAFVPKFKNTDVKATMEATGETVLITFRDMSSRPMIDLTLSQIKM